MAFLLANIELILSALGLVVIVLIPVLVDPKPDSLWKVVAVTATTVGLLHGVIFWLIRRRQRAIRADLIQELRTILADVINNQLIALTLHARKLSPASDRGKEIDEHLRIVDQSAKTISDYVNLLSEESIRQWKERYDRPAG
jgi:hypothetical protein